ncbi:MAG: hypothetical protein LBE92_20810 [Chryseobacterium sp.]|jgi:hypothetical protein|uniref:hypothetical protein n=1 Tax=Chryseobacterium sp. TaxID=1871047 RepID=UPI00281AE17D|nr:hypothetical protein [Chryseobacterium sp.]MDR2238578.1 hypothetical protein [Chryseobacterium sp.]
MTKKIVLGIFCLAQFSFMNAKNFPDETLTANHTALHGSFQQVPKTVIIKTKKFKIRIDKQPNGRYLYQSWGANSSITSKPHMIISDGELVPDGSGGNYSLVFNNEGYIYQVWRNYLTNSSKKAPYTLTVTDDNDREIVREDGIVVKK